MVALIWKYALLAHEIYCDTKKSIKRTCITLLTANKNMYECYYGKDKRDHAFSIICKERKTIVSKSLTRV